MMTRKLGAACAKAMRREKRNMDDEEVRSRMGAKAVRAADKGWY